MYGNGPMQDPMIGAAMRDASQMQTNVAPGTPRNMVGAELDSNEKRVATLHQALELLEQKLSPILGPPPPNARDKQVGEKAASAVVNMLRQHGYSLDAAVYRLGDLIERIEL